MNDLRDLLERSASMPPHDDFDLAEVVIAGRRRVRRRRAGLVGAALLSVVLVGGGAAALLDQSSPDFAAAGVPRPDAPTLRLTDATPAVEGTDYRVLASWTNENLDADNGQYFDGVTDDGLILFRDGPRMDQREPRFALLDPADGEKTWLPDAGIGQAQTWPVELGEERLVLVGSRGARGNGMVAHVFDRGTREWTTIAWPDLPRVGFPGAAQLGDDGRLYVGVPARTGQPPRGGWPEGPDGEADDADAEGDTYRLWSASLTDPGDVRDEGLTLGSMAFTGRALVWTDATNGESGQVHVRDLATGEETAFDPRSGERCNLLGFDATDEHVVMSQYCGTYEGGVRDDRVQVLDTAGRQVVTLQGSGISGELTSDAAGGVVTVTSYESDGAGTFVYDLRTGDFLRVSDEVSSWWASGPTPGGQFLWSTPENRGRGMTQHLGELLP